jgi:dinuclear metal center YbgI/SA1388 family protein
MAGVLLKDIIQVMEAIADPSLAFSWDNVGLQLGDEDAEIQKILIALDISLPVVSEAIDHNADLIISHHPLFFHPLTSLCFADPQADLARRLIKNNIAAYSAHTNLDKACLGSCHLLFEKLGLLDKQVMNEENQPSDHKKLVVFVPPEQAEGVFGVIAEGGGGRIGNYSHCSFRVAGTGTYRPETGATPYIGEVGRVEKANEIRLEALVPSKKVTEIISRIKKVHPYEEMAYDIYPLETAASMGIGRVGNLTRPMVLSDWAEEVKYRLGIDTLPLTGDPSSRVSRVAVVAGSGGGYIKAAKRCGAQCLITGDVGYHQARQAETSGIGLLDVGHFHSERLIVEFLVDKLSSLTDLVESGVIIRKAESEQDPFIINY